MTDVIAGRFALCDPIARGGSGVVWRAFDRKQERFCAAKVLRRRDAGDLLRFVREQSVRIAHPHVLTPYSWAAEDAHVVIASELADGGSLSTLLGDYGALDEATAAVLLDQLLDALEHVHAAGLVHRDVKPANLLLRATGTGRPHLMLSDFGIAMGAGDAHLTEVGTVVGTPGYLAPELTHGGVAPDPRHDLYAAGRVAVALLSGEEPRDVDPRPVLVAPGGLHDLVSALAAPHLLYRPPSAAVARSALRPVLAPDRGRHPRTAAGDPVDVLGQLPPLPAEALAEANGAPTERVNRREQAHGTTAPLDPDALNAVRAEVTTDARQQPNDVHTPHRRTRRRLAPRAVLAVAGAAAAVAVGVPVTAALMGGDAAGPPARTTSPTSSPSSPSGAGTPSGPTVTGSVANATVALGSACDWQQQGDRARTRADQEVVCTATADGYVWSRG